MTIDDAIHNLETNGRHIGNGFIVINHDRFYELLLKTAVIVLQDAGMIERDDKINAVRIINKPKQRVDYTTDYNYV